MTQFNTGSEYKSKGERAIAGFLTDKKIAFDYEYPLAVIDRGQVRIWYPDFKLPKYGMIIVYFGMNGNSGYNDQLAHKKRVYDGAGIEGIYLVEQSLQGHWQEMITERIEQVQQGRLYRIQRVRGKSRLAEKV